MAEIPPLKKQFIQVQMAEMSGSTFKEVMAENLYFQNVNLTGTKITDANLSDLHIEDAQIGGAIFRNIGLPPEDHPNYDSNATHRTVTFENCDLHASTVKNCDLSNVEISDCDMKGLKINGILVEDLLKNFNGGSD
ncbi:pentapeptide repeat-containing protein [Virgibacillus doumboii]|uniref:pentapeptide repeat-containing protein n=1 Tax=Virgibacillus doumboii TaxID=2697503 RepID=UPI0013E05BE3|nr:pentapeptide repeat-containing protein [Virgibacillus doumboii]